MAILSQQLPNFDQNIYYEIHSHMDRSKRCTFIGIYGKSNSGKSTFANRLSSVLVGDGWRAFTMAGDSYFKYDRASRNVMIEEAWKKYGPLPKYDEVQRDAYSIRQDIFEEDLKSYIAGRMISRDCMYKKTTGTLTGSLRFEYPLRSASVCIIDGFWLAGFRKYFDIMIRMEAAYEVRRQRYEARAQASDYRSFPWLVDNLDRVVDEDIYKNWDLKDTVVRSDEGFTLQ
jgi:uridine kinase